MYYVRINAYPLENIFGNLRGTLLPLTNTWKFSIVKIILFRVISISIKYLTQKECNSFQTFFKSIFCFVGPSINLATSSWKNRDHTKLEITTIITSVRFPCGLYCLFCPLLLAGVLFPGTALYFFLGWASFLFFSWFPLFMIPSFLATFFWNWQYN